MEKLSEFIQKSNRIELNSFSLKKTVYFTHSNNLEIQISDSLKEKIESNNKHVFQVFVNNMIQHEAYLSQVEFPVRITLPGVEILSKHDVEIKII